MHSHLGVPDKGSMRTDGGRAWSLDRCHIRTVFRWIVLAILLMGCEDVSRFKTTDEDVFRGPVIGDEPLSFIRRGFAPGTVLQLDFDPSEPDRRVLGRMSTIDEAGLRVFEQTELESIPPLAHDELSEFSFPGPGRVRNFMLIARPESGPLAGRDAMVVVSLLDSGGVEVRIIAGSGDEDRGDYFGLFLLRRSLR